MKMCSQRTNRLGIKGALGNSQRRKDALGFTLIELLVVILIIGLLAVATLPVVVPSLQQSKIGAAARELQAELSRARDEAVRTNRPQGLRFLPDDFDPTVGHPYLNRLTSHRYIAIEQGPDYSEGALDMGSPPSPPSPIIPPGYLVVHESKYTVIPMVGTIPNAPTGWFWNLRQGDRLRINGTGHIYTVVGPMLEPNTDRFINFGTPQAYPTGPASTLYEFLYLVNGVDDDGDGFIDESFDGIDNDGDGIVDPGFNGIDDDSQNGSDDPGELIYNRYAGYVVGSHGNEFEQEEFKPSHITGLRNAAYTVLRRPVPSPAARESNLPQNVVLDLTSWDADKIPVRNAIDQPYVPERSRLPVDPSTGYVDILISPGGQVIQQTFTANPAPSVQLPYYHFWLTDLEDVADQTFPPGAQAFLLPMLKGSSDDPSLTSGPYAQTYPDILPPLRANRRLVSLNVQTGQVVTTSVETMYTNNPSYPFKAAESGQKEEP
jgi:prepilin-type N-terminal cleavage/methylation domain-containing protein